MLVYAVRHGESEANIGQFYSGHLDVGLSEKGNEDAEKAGELLRGITFDKIYSSDLKRAIHTCEIAIPGSMPIQTALLREIDVGNLMGRKWSECREEGGEAFNEALKLRAFKDFGGETREEHRTRVAEFLMSLEALCNKTDVEAASKTENARVAVFCHNGTILRMIETVCGPDSSEGLKIRNCEICIFEYRDGVWSFKGTLYDEDKDAKSTNEQLNEER